MTGSFKAYIDKNACPNPFSKSAILVDHTKLGKSGNSLYENVMKSLDKKDKTDYYMNFYNDDRKQNK